MDAKARTATAIAQAKAELDQALLELETIPALDPALVGIVAHALNNYITVTSAAVEMLQMSLLDHPDDSVPVWLDGIGRAANMMRHAIGRLVSVGAPRDFPLRMEYVNLPVLIERACDYYRRRWHEPHARIVSQSIGAIPLVWADRVALAVVADNLLSYAVRISPPHETIRIQILAEPGHVTCSIRDSGPGITPEQFAALFERSVAESVANAVNEDLSLAVAREFVERMDGMLWGESTVSAGSCISFRLPALE